MVIDWNPLKMRHCDANVRASKDMIPLKSIEPILRLKNLPLIKVIHQNRRRRMSVHPNTPLSMRSNTRSPSP